MTSGTLFPNKVGTYNQVPVQEQVLSPDLQSASVALVDDEPLFRGSVAQALRRNGYRVQCAGAVTEAIELLTLCRPNILLLDVLLPDGSAEDVLDQVSPSPEMRVALITGSFDGDRWLRLTRRCDLILPKPISLGSVVELVAKLQRPTPVSNPIAPFFDHYRLSPRERRIIELAIEGANDKEIAAACDCSRGTVATHWKRIFKKTDKHSQRDVIAAILRF